MGLEFVEAALTEGGADMNAYDKGRMLYHIGNYNEAISALEKVDKEQYARVSLYLGMSYEALGDFNYAANVYEAGLTENNDPAFYNQLGLCLMKCGKYEKALEAFQAGLDFEGNANRQALRFNEAVAYEYLADFDTAKRLMEAYLKDYPKDELARREYTFLESR